MKELELALDELVAGAPVENASWDDVRARSRRRRITPRGRTRLVTAVAAAALLGLAGTAVTVGLSLLEQQERFHAEMLDDPERLGPLVEITSGENWALIAWRSRFGICLDFAIPGNSPFGCGFPVRGAKPPSDSSGGGAPTHAVAGFVSGGNLVGGDGKGTIFGVAAREVVRVDVELSDGRVVAAPLHDAPAELDADVRFFIVRLPLPPQTLRGKSPVRSYSAYGRDGALIERVED